MDDGRLKGACLGLTIGARPVDLFLTVPRNLRRGKTAVPLITGFGIVLVVVVDILVAARLFFSVLEVSNPHSSNMAH
jgi:hypothetical protein